MATQIDREQRRLTALADELDADADAMKQQANVLRTAADALADAPRVKQRRRSSTRRRTPAASGQAER